MSAILAAGNPVMMFGQTVTLSNSERTRVQHVVVGEHFGALLAVKQADHGIPAHAVLETTFRLALDSGRGYFRCLSGGDKGATRSGKHYARQFLTPGEYPHAVAKIWLGWASGQSPRF